MPVDAGSTSEKECVCPSLVVSPRSSKMLSVLEMALCKHVKEENMLQILTLSYSIFCMNIVELAQSVDAGFCWVIM
jgi:hypothetical protein